ncbi:chromatin assembly factor 1 subunit A [Nitzschia inconspicua]|uniref:Chromatin assembly factor 1 subunit A n=1 Tax=Nitzschia inconspicua TaxID=303405 RepID=A0A9K3KMF2_9STRA|nr:chromatin assembly factor 1 subunit A [Nitzschia inconspicua]
MPSLVSVSQQTAPVGKTTDYDSSSSQEGTVTGHSENKTDPTMMDGEDRSRDVESSERVVSSIDDGTSPKHTHPIEEPSAKSSTTPKSKKRKVTPGSDIESKQSQQKKVNQLSLSSFFLPAGSNKSTTSTPPPSSHENCTRISSSTKKRKVTSHTSGVLEKISSSTRKSPRTKTLNRTEDKTMPLIRKKVGRELDEDNEKLDTGSGDAELPAQDIQTDGDRPQREQNLKANEEEEVVGLCNNTEEENDEETSAGGEVSKTNDQNEPPITVATKKQKTKRRAAAKSKTTVEERSVKEESEPPTRLAEEEFDDDRRTLLHNYRTMKERYLERVAQLIDQAKRGIEEESYEVPKLEALGEGESLDDDEFPTQVVSNMALLIEGSDLSLSKLTPKVCDDLKQVHGKEWTAENVSAKIKVLAQRKAYFDASTKPTTSVDIFEDEDEERLWRWEITTLDLLPSETLTNARKARSARKKVGSYHAAVVRLLKSLDEADDKLFDPKQPKMDNIVAKISRDEEKVLKYEREAEKQRLADEAKARKLEEQEAKKKAREEAAEKKRREKEEAAEKKRREKEEATQAREDAKRKKEEEKEQEEQMKKEEEEKRKKNLAIQKNSFISFFKAPQKPQPTLEMPKTPAATAPNRDFDAEVFRSKINSSSENLSLDFTNLSSVAISSRKRRTKRVPVMIYTTVTSADEGAWDAPAYAEQKTIMVPNKYRFLSFHEDCRPAYHGTWSKRSCIVTGKTPFGKETKIFDYEYDSEAEWEEGDDEVGEDVDDDAKNEEEEEEGAALYDFEDGFCVADDKMLDNEENADDETRALYKKKLQSGDRDQQMLSNRIRIIAPGPGGVPLHLIKKNITTDRLEGLLQREVANAVESYEGETLYDLKLCLDSFPQLHMDEEKQAIPPANTAAVAKEKEEYTKEAMIAMARSVHHSTLNSKEKIVEDLRNAYPSFFSVRAKATRKLDSIASKQKHPSNNGGYYWQVKEEVLIELGLTELVGKAVEIPDSENPVEPIDKKSKNGKTGKKRKRSTKENSKPSQQKKKKRKNDVAPADDSETPPKKRNSTDNPKSTGSGTKGKKIVPSADVSVGMKNLMANFLQKK